jgi:hypothetical protein
MTYKEEITKLIQASYDQGAKDTQQEAITALEQIVAAARADEREACAKRRGVLAFCPYTGRPRHPSDIASDPHGILILVPDQPLRGMKP